MKLLEKQGCFAESVSISAAILADLMKDILPPFTPQHFDRWKRSEFFKENTQSSLHGGFITLHIKRLTLNNCSCHIYLRYSSSSI